MFIRDLKIGAFCEYLERQNRKLSRDHTSRGQASGIFSGFQREDSCFQVGRFPQHFSRIYRTIIYVVLWCMYYELFRHNFE